MTETHERVAEDAAAEYAHILTDLHQQCREVAGLRAEVAGLRLDLGRAMALIDDCRNLTAGVSAAIGELLPAARRAAAMLDTPVTAYLQARKEANGGERFERAGESRRRGRRPRAT